MKKIFTLLFLLTFTFAEAQEKTIQQLSFEGLKRTKEHFLRKLMKVKEGSVYDSLLANEDIERLNRLPGIAKARKKIVDTNEGIKLTYEVEENFTIIPGLRIASANNGSFAYRLSLFEFNFLGNNQLLGGFYERNVFDSYGFFWEHPFLFSDQWGIGLSYRDETTQEPIFVPGQRKDYRYNANTVEAYTIWSIDFKNEVELGASYVQEQYDFLEGEPIQSIPPALEADKLIYRAQYRFIDLDIDYQYFIGTTNEFTAQYNQLLSGDVGGNEFLQDFLALRNDFIHYRKIRSRGNWASRLRLATVFGNEDSPFAPFTLDNQLNIRGVGNTVDRGISAIVLNTEYRHTLYEKGWFVMQGNVFIDAGSWQNPGEDFSELFDGSNVKFHPGLGVRFIHKRIFNAVFRLDYGIGIGNNATNGIVFGIGQYF